MVLGTLTERLERARLLLLLIMGFAATASSARAQLLYSFETGLERWANTGFTGSGASDLISVSQAAEGATHGTYSMAVETGNAIPPDTSAFGWDVNTTVTAMSLPAVYNAFNTAAQAVPACLIIAEAHACEGGFLVPPMTGTPPESVRDLEEDIHAVVTMANGCR